MRRRFLRHFIVGVLALAGSAGVSAAAPAPVQAAGQVKVVYHLVEGNSQAQRALGNIRNHLRAAPQDRIVVVAHGEGIRFLLKEAVDRNGKPFDDDVAALAARGVEFRVCRNTLASHDVSAERLLPQASLVESGVAEVARLQAQEGFVYLRP
ncbi:DsrE family protein [Janthinobacterium sp. 17J80-10]|uniref:DsrE family protein n=1 Tax=Janthinobacterium sp. 17J80-10 TaxID=2497863 RepID=UPI0010057906|nr:DsrE family protein [Janthinobacterium sp. 17J80-10]QAU33206.1 hypothetical protein EKL02_02870 [Janthinobacterium sp. 17J80-10]